MLEVHSRQKEFRRPLYFKLFETICRLLRLKFKAVELSLTELFNWKGANMKQINRRPIEQGEAIKQVNLDSYSIDIYSAGVAIGQHRPPADSDPRLDCALKLPSPDGGESPRVCGGVLKVGGKYSVSEANPLDQVERLLIKLSRQGVLGRSTFYLGVSSDPFHPFAGKFDTSMRVLELFKRYQPGFLSVQTRSPLVVIAMPIFKALGNHVGVTFGIETFDEQVANRLTPHIPRVAERVKAVNSLRRLGVEVTVQVAPLLPYGEWRDDAHRFANWLAAGADYLLIKPLVNRRECASIGGRKCPIAKRLADERRFHWLRSDAAEPLSRALVELCPEKLLAPKRVWLEERQIALSVA